LQAIPKKFLSNNKFGKNMMRQPAIGAVLLVALAGCGSEFRTAAVNVKSGMDGISLAGVQRDGELVYAFAWPTGVPKLDTNDPSIRPRAKGIHFCYSCPDGLWFNGEKVRIPKDSPVFALRRDGTVIPIPLREEELLQVTALTTPGNKAESIPDGPLKQKLLSHFDSGVEVNEAVTRRSGETGREPN
jgi:hypothetical protein